MVAVVRLEVGAEVGAAGDATAGRTWDVAVVVDVTRRP